jgi:adiponectin receptor
MRPVFRTPTYRPFRSLMYFILGLSIFIPAIHGILLHGVAVQNQRMSLVYFMGLGVLNGIGTAIYAARIPERWFPRRFDIWGNSHQIMHVLVVCGALSHTVGLVKAFEYWHGLDGGEGGACAGLEG